MTTRNQQLKEKLEKEKLEDERLAIEEEWLRQEEEENMQVFEYQQTQDLVDNEWVEIPKSGDASPEKKKPNLPILTMPEEQQPDVLDDPDEEEL